MTLTGIKLSQASKMPCRSWSLEARTHCPASVELSGPNKGELVAACAGCYAAGGNYRFLNVRAPRLHNAQDWKRAEWVADMVAAIGTDSHFRWFDSGDLFAVALARKVLDVMRRTPATRHWLPTRMHKFAKFAHVLAQMAALPNVVVRRSSDSVSGETVKGATTSTIFGKRSELSAGARVCPAYTRDGKCGDCRACWDKTIAVVAYPAHGKVMLSLIARSAA